MQAVEREGALQESHNLYMSLKQFMMKLPDHTVVEKLTATKVNTKSYSEGMYIAKLSFLQRALTAKTRKMKALAAELKCNEMDDKDAEQGIQELQATILELRQQLIKQKKDNQRLRERLNEAHNEESASGFAPTTSEFKTLAAGFRVPTTAHSDIS